LTLNLAGKHFQFGRCVYHFDDSVPPFKGRLVFVDDVYDFRTILESKRTYNLDTYFQSLPLVLAQKKKVHDDFRNYTSDLTYDLMVYRKHFDELDTIYRNEPLDVYRLVQQTVLETAGRKFFDFFNSKLDELIEITKDYTLQEHENHAYYLRRQVWDFIMASSFLSRTNLKPRGYAGDSEMMSIIYRNLYEGNSIFEKLMHKHPIETLSARAVRNRKVMIPQLIYEARSVYDELPDLYRVFSVASGAARELENIIITPADCQDYRITLLDQDPEALAEASNCIKRIENRFTATLEHNFIFESVRTMLRIKDLKKEWGDFHFIYSMGLFDYLSPRVGKAVLEKLYTLLLPGGTMVIGNYHESNPTKTYMDYWGDWVLYYRSEEDFLELTSELSAQNVKIIYEESGCQMFLILTKPRESKI
jgi:extracellular factor (EF) 3-hydroxypalmitic acid methyl ester biosynthesis protein